jgi:hypothetical protein
MTGVGLHSFTSKRLGSCTVKGKKMAYIQRQVQHIYPGKWEELEAIDKEYTKIEGKYGFSAKKRYRMMSGPDDMSTLIVENQWESLADMEKAYEKLMADPEWKALEPKADTIVKDNRLEILLILP